MSIGVAAHITAASPGGPRYDPKLTAAERRSVANGIWLCQTCSVLIDRDEKRYTGELLHKWKRDSVEKAFAALATGRSLGSVKPAAGLDDDDLAFLRTLRLAEGEDTATVEVRMRNAAAIDAAVYQSYEWPARTVTLSLTLQGKERRPIALDGVASAVTTTEALSFIAPPGTGKSTTLIQLADRLIENNGAVPLLIPLGEWSDRPDDFFDFLTRRNAYRGFERTHFMQQAYHGRVVLLLDGWNEIDPDSRARAIRDIKNLQREYPQLPLVVSTRPHALPVAGPVVQIEPLSEDQQLELARAIRGSEGEALVDQAWRTPGVRELVSIPLYLNALLVSVEASAFPQTKEEVLRIFVRQHEAALEQAEVLRRDVQGFQADMLVGLAVEANRTANTAISAHNARRSITAVERRLADDGQIGALPQPNVVLDALVNAHVLVRSPSNDGAVSFQHQQFQEWYGSFEVEQLMTRAAEADTAARERLRSEVLNWSSWEESILFACDRLSRAGESGARSVAAAIDYALGIDPMLAANMIYRADPSVWPLIAERVIAFVRRWHKPGTNDRAVRFMITTGRPEFEDLIWPLVSSSDDQTHLHTMRMADRFRPSVLGGQQDRELRSLPDQVRKNVLHEIAANSGFDGMELATRLAQADPSAEVVLSVLHALKFRRADRHVNRIMEGASGAVWQAVAKDGYPDVLTDPALNERLENERVSLRSAETDPVRALTRILQDAPEDAAARVTAAIASATFEIEHDRSGHALARARELYPVAVAEGIAGRVIAGLPLPYDAASYVAPLKIIDDGPLAAVALDASASPNHVRTAASVIGPSTVATLLDRLFTMHDAFASADTSPDQAQRDAYHELRGTIGLTPQQSFVTALIDRASTDEPERARLLAELLGQHGQDVGKTPSIQGDANRAALRNVIAAWIEVVLRPSADRHQCSSIAGAAARLADPALADGMRRMVERDLVDRAAARASYFASSRRGPMPADVTVSYALDYRRAFAAMGGDEVVTILTAYLSNLTFGIDAAGALLDIWRKDHSVSERLFGFSHDFSVVVTRRLERESGDPPSSPFADAMFAAAMPLASADKGAEEQRHAIGLATIAIAMPYGVRRGDLDRILALPQPFATKRQLLTAMALGGEVISADLLMAGLRELLQDAQRDRWRLEENRGELMGWMVLFPFSDRPLDAIEAIDLLPPEYQQSWHLRRLLQAISDGPPDTGLQVLEGLASRRPEVMDQYEWLGALIKLDTEQAGLALLNRLDDQRLLRLASSDFRIPDILAGFARRFPTIRTELLRRYGSMSAGRARALIEGAVAELADEGCVIALVEVQAAENRNDGCVAHALRQLAVGERPSDSWPGADDQFSVPLTDLRRRLFSMTASGDPRAVLAEYALDFIERERDELGRVNNEPRHPDLASGRPWPPSP